MADRPEYPIVLVLWRDAFSHHSGWVTLADLSDDHDEQIVHSTGFLIPETEPGGRKGHVTLWQTLADGDAINQFNIPVDMVVQIVYLTDVESLTHLSDFL